MIGELYVDNYRSLQDCKLSGLTRFTLLTGANDLGKSTLLEAVFMLYSGANGPFKAFQFEMKRGLQPITAGLQFGTSTITPAVSRGHRNDSVNR